MGVLAVVFDTALDRLAVTTDYLAIAADDHMILALGWVTRIWVTLIDSDTDARLIRWVKPSPSGARTVL